MNLFEICKEMTGFQRPPPIWLDDDFVFHHQLIINLKELLYS